MPVLDSTAGVEARAFVHRLEACRLVRLLIAAQHFRWGDRPAGVTYCSGGAAGLRGRCFARCHSRRSSLGSTALAAGNKTHRAGGVVAVDEHSAGVALLRAPWVAQAFGVLRDGTRVCAMATPDIPLPATAYSPAASSMARPLPRKCPMRNLLIQATGPEWRIIRKHPATVACGKSHTPSINRRFCTAAPSHFTEVVQAQ